MSREILAQIEDLARAWLVQLAADGKHVEARQFAADLNLMACGLIEDARNGVAVGTVGQ